MLSATTFCSFLREFSSLEVYARWTRVVLIGRTREPCDCIRSRSSVRASASRNRADFVNTMASAAVASAAADSTQLEIEVSGSHVGHDVVRFTSIRDWRATFLAASSSAGIWLPVPKYISFGV